MARKKTCRDPDERKENTLMPISPMEKPIDERGLNQNGETEKAEKMEDEEEAHRDGFGQPSWTRTGWRATSDV